MNNPVLACHDLQKTFQDGQLNVTVLKGVNLTIHAKDRIAILGSSGSGKSTLLHLLGGLDQPSAGEVQLNGISFSHLSESKRSLLRNRYLGFVYQFHHLLPEFSALENVCMPLLMRQQAKADMIEKAQDVLNKVGLSHRLQHRPAELSGGEKQRVAIARALVTEPLCILADEPTGNLDTRTALQVYETFQQLNENFNTSVVIVTHDERIAKQMPRCFTMEDGQLR
ncbi:MAG: lipoprotein-releasing ABC transporter ATP-binding protein LolD [Legionellales bacterium]|nr:lipoprotein-releasing ABC transporter ATP-binding protein LolD [Legionellales bacterium]